MNVHDEEFLDTIAVLALGALPEAEARELAAHVRTCASCLALYREFRETANFVGYDAEIGVGASDELASARMKSNVMRAVRASATPPAVSAASIAPAQRRPVGSYLAYVAAAAAIVVALLTNAHDIAMRNEREGDRQRIAALEARATAQTAESAAANARIVAILAPGSKRFGVPGGDVVTSGGHVYLALRDLAPPPAGKVYQAWTLAKGAKAVAPSVTFVPGTGGATVIELPEGAAGLAAVALSVEPAGGSKAPTSKPAFVRPLS